MTMSWSGHQNAKFAEFESEEAACRIPGHAGVEAVNEALDHLAIGVGELRRNREVLVIDDSEHLLVQRSEARFDRLTDLVHVIERLYCQSFEIDEEHVLLRVVGETLLERYREHV